MFERRIEPGKAVTPLERIQEAKTEIMLLNMTISRGRHLDGNEVSPQFLRDAARRISYLTNLCSDICAAEPW